jgi:hypothetical protein
MKKPLLFIAAAFAVLITVADAAEKPAKPPKKEPKKDTTEEVHRMDPFKVNHAYDLSYSAPVAIKIIRPRVHSKYAGEHFELKFTVDRVGTPYNFGATDMRVDAELVFQVISAVRAWQFYPAHNSDGLPVERKVILPIIVVGAE